MSTVVTVFATKGGVGETTTAVNLTGGLAEHGDVVLVDCDPQGAGSSTHWLGDPASTFTVTKVRDIGDLEKLVRRWPGIVVIDTPRSDDPVTHAAIALSTLVICPCGPSQAEVMAACQTAKLVPATVPYRVLRARVDGRSLDMYRQATGALDAVRIPRHATCICQRSAHQ